MVKKPSKDSPDEAPIQIKWLPTPEKHDYPAAVSYLSLTMEPAEAKIIARNLEKAKMAEFAAKDIFRASGLPLLGIDNSHVEKNVAKIARGHELSPLLLFRDKRTAKVVIADGYHRMCAVYTFNEDAKIPCKIV